MTDILLEKSQTNGEHLYTIEIIINSLLQYLQRLQVSIPLGSLISPPKLSVEIALLYGLSKLYTREEGNVTTGLKMILPLLSKLRADDLIIKENDDLKARKDKENEVNMGEGNRGDLLLLDSGKNDDQIGDNDSGEKNDKSIDDDNEDDNSSSSSSSSSGGISGINNDKNKENDTEDKLLSTADTTDTTLSETLTPITPTPPVPPVPRLSYERQQEIRAEEEEEKVALESRVFFLKQRLRIAEELTVIGGCIVIQSLSHYVTNDVIMHYVAIIMIIVIHSYHGKSDEELTVIGEDYVILMRLLCDR